MELQVPWCSATRRALCSLGVCAEGGNGGLILLPKGEEEEEEEKEGSRS